MKIIVSTLIVMLCTFSAISQNELWEAKDKQKLIDNYKRAFAELNAETESLTKKQWNYRIAEGKWTIGQVVEHLNMWHLITQDQIRYAEWLGPKPELVSKTMPDSVVTKFIYEEKNHTSPDLSIPTGLIPDVNNLKIFNIKANEIMKKLESSTIDFSQYFRVFTDEIRNLYQIYIIHYGHIDRHIRQIKRIKADANFPN
jgi:hypothetical protein